ncbi:MAG: carboxypeptidase regulatory-like domain-containing protein [Gemmatimonadota bacterium]
MRSRLLTFLLALPLGAGALHAQDPAGRLEGFVFDSTTGETLSGARVVMWGTAYQVESDAVGSFLFEDIPVGSYSIVFFHPRLGHLGISSGSQQVEVGLRQSEPLVLSTPSMSTIVGQMCLLDTGNPNAANVTGQVIDATEGVGMPRARVILRWQEAGRERERPVDTDVEGWFSVCGVPRDVDIAASAEFLGLSSPRREFRVAPAQTHRVDFPLGELDESSVTGGLTDMDSGDPIEGAQIQLRDTRFSTMSDERGLFRLRDVPPGEYTLVVSHITHATRTEAISVGSGVGVNLGIVMAEEAIELDPIIVTIEAQTMAEQLSAGGHLVTAEELAPVKERVTTLVDLLFQAPIPGLIVRRAEGDICAQFASGQVRFMKSGCESATFYIDGARQASAQVLMDLPDDIIDHIVVYRPVEAGAIFGTGGSRGVVMIYTKGGVRRSQRR